MATPDQSPSSVALLVAQQTADGLALAFEDAGFDVGREFPVLCGTLDSRGEPVVAIGRISQKTAMRLSAALSQAATLGASVARE